MRCRLACRSNPDASWCSAARHAKAAPFIEIPTAGGDGGAIALDAHGNAAFPFNTEGMYRGWIGADGTRMWRLAIFKDETL
ncbi:hypothetical protein FDU21_15275 [Xanthomonas oryzae pv. oryzae]|nr:hypothetical protein FDU21_15275 [Xanthomonas oryzae pv. oryzae]